jgi:hypothetical protein
MPSDHPFQTLFETFGKLPAAHADAVNRRAFMTLGATLSVPVGAPGRCILLKAPRAGHGKTHLLSRVQHQLGGSHEFIPLHAASGSRIGPVSAMGDALRRLSRHLPAAGGLTVLDLLVRRLFAEALQPLVMSGEVPCQDREGALAALRQRPVETFDFHHPNAVTAHWARENFEVLGPRLSLELSARTGLTTREVSFWVEVFFQFAATPADHPERLRVLADSVEEGQEEGAAMDRLGALLGLLSLLVRVVLVADELEGFSTDESAALKMAAFVGALRQSVEPLEVILSVNHDIWESAFLPRLSGGLADRLSEVVIELEPLTEAEIVQLFDSRVPGLGAVVLGHLDLHKVETHPRGLLRAAAAAWIEAAERRAGVQNPDGPTVPAESRVLVAVADGSVASPEPKAEAAVGAETIAKAVEPGPDSPAADTEVELGGRGANGGGAAPVVAAKVAVAEQVSAAFLVAEEAGESGGSKPGGGASDRVDDLLRQFRERYGRTSL